MNTKAIKGVQTKAWMLRTPVKTALGEYAADVEKQIPLLSKFVQKERKENKAPIRALQQAQADNDDAHAHEKSVIPAMCNDLNTKFKRKNKLYHSRRYGCCSSSSISVSFLRPISVHSARFKHHQPFCANQQQDYNISTGTELSSLGHATAHHQHSASRVGNNAKIIKISASIKQTLMPISRDLKERIAIRRIKQLKNGEEDKKSDDPLAGWKHPASMNDDPMHGWHYPKSLQQKKLNRTESKRQLATTINDSNTIPKESVAETYGAPQMQKSQTKIETKQEIDAFSGWNNPTQFLRKRPRCKEEPDPLIGWHHPTKVRLMALMQEQEKKSEDTVDIWPAPKKEADPFKNWNQPSKLTNDAAQEQYNQRPLEKSKQPIKSEPALTASKETVNSWRFHMPTECLQIDVEHDPLSGWKHPATLKQKANHLETLQEQYLQEREYKQQQQQKELIDPLHGWKHPRNVRNQHMLQQQKTAAINTSVQPKAYPFSEAQQRTNVVNETYANAVNQGDRIMDNRASELRYKSNVSKISITKKKTIMRSGRKSCGLKTPKCSPSSSSGLGRKRIVAAPSKTSPLAVLYRRTAFQYELKDRLHPEMRPSFGHLQKQKQEESDFMLMPPPKYALTTVKHEVLAKKLQKRTTKGFKSSWPKDEFETLAVPTAAVTSAAAASSAAMPSAAVASAAVASAAAASSAAAPLAAAIAIDFSCASDMSDKRSKAKEPQKTAACSALAMACKEANQRRLNRFTYYNQYRNK